MITLVFTSVVAVPILGVAIWGIYIIRKDMKLIRRLIDKNKEIK